MVKKDKRNLVSIVLEDCRQFNMYDLRVFVFINYPFKYEAQTALFKDPVRTAQ